MEKKRILGFVFIILSIGITISNITTTGAVIGTSLSNYFSIVAIVLLIVGIILISSRDRNYAQEILDNKRYVDKEKEIKSIAKKMGYYIEEAHREGTKVYNEKGGDIITVIPHHRRGIKKGTSRNILEALASGESNFKKRRVA